MSHFLRLRNSNRLGRGEGILGILYLPGPLLLPIRYLHATTVVGDRLIIYGGLAEGQGDVWAFDFGKGSWALLANEVGPCVLSGLISIINII